MEILELKTDVSVLCQRAAAFPEGILAAHQQLHSIVPFSIDRRYFGMSRPENGGEIVYHAAAEQLHPGEAGKWQLETRIIRKGRYVYQDILNYQEDVSQISATFDQLLQQPGLDPQGYCVESFLNDKDLRCMIRLADN